MRRRSLNPMEFMLPLKYVNDQDKRALALYFIIALLCTACLAFVMLYRSDFRVGKKAGPEQAPPPAPKLSPRNRQ